MRILVLNPRKKRNQNPGHQYTFYEVLKVLYHFIDEESKHDKGKILHKMKKIKKNILQLAEDTGNLALLNNWFDIDRIGKNKLKNLVDYDDYSGSYTAKKIID